MKKNDIGYGSKNGINNVTYGEDNAEEKGNSMDNAETRISNEDALFHIKDGLTQLEKTLKGDGYAFSNLICKNKNLDHIPKEIEKYIHLKYINMSHNKIEDIDMLYELNNVVFLDISYNLIKNLKKIASLCLKNCVYLNLSHNLIKNVEDIKMTNIIELDLSYNNIEKMNIYFSNTVKKLNLSNNNISNLDFKNKLNDLESLDLSSNPIKNLEFFEITPNINYLKINNNTTLPISQLANLNSFKGLQYLDMQNYLYFKDISYEEVMQILIKNTKDIKLKMFNGKLIDNKA
ncbi:leucine-rich repeat protein [Plasmodium gonderi]|uniref:Leucine-rich repeat protein n=1 Tax=Plasmodium gonderi TaxID=77519 RepID=A0A1Y1JIM6_PLAGO|nr:leucine-rich repeat protein [Plasmodium gonderi]GAW81225.1 leucine-rich repeat protein [Plasmodium gonderi]